MPQSLIEAMSLGKIVIASDTLGARDLIKDRKNGFLFNVGDKKDLNEKINFILKLKPTDIRKIQNQARKSVKQFNWNEIIKKIQNLIKEK